MGNPEIKKRRFWEQTTTPVFLSMLQATLLSRSIKNYTLMTTQFRDKFLSIILTPSMLNCPSYNLKGSHHCSVSIFILQK
jgi:hypothetical protein